MDRLLKDAELFKLLEQVDWDLARSAQESGCEHCEGGTLHRGDYDRKPRGGPEEAMARWDKRYSFCCSQEGCRKRKTPPSVRFLGRKVYTGVVVILVAAMMHGPSARDLATLHEALGIDKRTLKRWRKWWLEDFVSTPFWKAACAMFMPVLSEAVMPYCLVERFKADRNRERLRDVMKFISPITTVSMGGAGAM